ncbi:MAG: formate dehydrogenase accessory sulfurtransferase FdhD [Smithella sp.]
MSNFDENIKTFKIFSTESNSIARSCAKVIREVVLDVDVNVDVNGKPLASIACAGIYPEELAIGLLRSEKIITTSEEIVKIEINNHENRVNVILKNKKSFPKASVKNISSSGARGSSANIETLLPLLVPVDFKIKAKMALKLMNELWGKSVLHNKIGGTHCSSLASIEKIIALCKDIGRHNTIDMLGGYALLRKINLSDKIILTAGRISSKIVYKVWNLGIPVIIFHSAPTAKAIELLHKANIMLMGYVRNGRMNIYSHERRIII